MTASLAQHSQEAEKLIEIGFPSTEKRIISHKALDLRRQIYKQSSVIL
jgi:hypothetical protein